MFILKERQRVFIKKISVLIPSGRDFAVIIFALRQINLVRAQFFSLTAPFGRGRNKLQQRRNRG